MNKVKPLYYELGHEFWGVELSDQKHKQLPMKYQEIALSGRTALDWILKDILMAQPLRRAYLPAYCCETMIIPFLQNGIEVKFYDVQYVPGKGLVEKIDAEVATDLFYAIDYFGHVRAETDEWTKHFQNRGIVTIEDCTHSWLSKKNFQADYTYTSLRKWTGLVAGALIWKKDIAERLVALDKLNLRLEDLRARAFSLKRDYLFGENIEKQKYLDLFAEAETLLDVDYAGYAVSEKVKEQIKGIDIEFIKMRRRENWVYLCENVHSDKIVPLFDTGLKEEECPLFFPILVSGNRRDELRSELRRQEIYCPAHWPLSQYHSLMQESEILFRSELSVLCDQRYQPKDLDRMIRIINQF